MHTVSESIFNHVHTVLLCVCMNTEMEINWGSTLSGGKTVRAHEESDSSEILQWG